MRAALYARVSTEQQEQQGTIGSQIEALRCAALAQGMEVVKEYVDDGHSGARLDRPGLDSLRDAAASGLFEIVLVLCPDRLARRYAYQVLILEEFERLGVRMHFLEQAPPEDSNGRLLVQIQGIIAEYERAKMAERYRRGKLYRARQGEVICGKVAYGYTRVPRRGSVPAYVEVHEPSARVVQKIFHLYTENRLSVRQIALRLVQEGIPSPSGNEYWGTSTIDRILRNEAYVGRMYYNRRHSVGGRVQERPRDEWISIPVPSIIDQATFTRAQVTHGDNSQFSPRRTSEDKYLLRRLVRCGSCDAATSCHKMRGRNGQIHHYYYCCQRHDPLRARGRACDQRNIRADALDDFVWQEVRRHLVNPDLLRQAYRLVSDGDASKKQLDLACKRTTAAKGEHKRLLDAYQAGIVSLDELQTRMGPLRQRIAQLSEEESILTAELAVKKEEAHLLNRLDAFCSRVKGTIDQLSFKQKQHLIRMVVEKVMVRDWTVKIYLRIPIHPSPGHDSDDHCGSPTTEVSSDIVLRSNRSFSR